MIIAKSVFVVGSMTKNSLKYFSWEKVAFFEEIYANLSQHQEKGERFKRLRK